MRYDDIQPEQEIQARVTALQRQMARCDLCPRRCHVNRLEGEVGFCKTGREAVIAHVGLHLGEEPPLSGDRGSGTIFFAHCNLRCVYCQNFQISQCAEQIPTRALSPAALADEMLRLQARGAHNVNLVSPTHVAAQVAQSLCLARARGLTLPVVYNTNGYEALETLQALEGLIDVYLPDIKYSDDQLARHYSGVDDYVTVNRRAIREMFRQVGNLVLDGEGIAQRGLLVRHLVLPEDCAGSRESLRFLAALSTDMVVSLMAQYSPQYKARGLPPLDRTITEREYEAVLEMALDLGLERCFVQAVESKAAFLPDFNRTDPFGSGEGA